MSASSQSAPNDAGQRRVYPSLVRPGEALVALAQAAGVVQPAEVRSPPSAGAAARTSGSPRGAAPPPAEFEPRLDPSPPTCPCSLLSTQTFLSCLQPPGKRASNNRAPSRPARGRRSRRPPATAQRVHREVALAPVDLLPGVVASSRLPSTAVPLTLWLSGRPPSGACADRPSAAAANVGHGWLRVPVARPAMVVVDRAPRRELAGSYRRGSRSSYVEDRVRLGALTSWPAGKPVTGASGSASPR